MGLCHQILQIILMSRMLNVYFLFELRCIFNFFIAVLFLGSKIKF